MVPEAAKRGSTDTQAHPKLLHRGETVLFAADGRPRYLQALRRTLTTQPMVVPSGRFGWVFRFRPTCLVRLSTHVLPLHNHPTQIDAGTGERSGYAFWRLSHVPAALSTEAVTAAKVEAKWDLPAHQARRCCQRQYRSLHRCGSHTHVSRSSICETDIRVISYGRVIGEHMPVGSSRDRPTRSGVT